MYGPTRRLYPERMDSTGKELERLAELRRSGSLDDTEYDILKARLLQDVLSDDSDTGPTVEKSFVSVEEETESVEEETEPAVGANSSASRPIDGPSPRQPGSFCEQCGASVDASTRFCGTCGTRLGKNEEVVSEPDTPEEQTPPPASVYPVSQFCRTCGKPVAATAAICLTCGTSQQSSSRPLATGATYAPEPKSAGVAILLTVLFPGAGHLYIGNTRKGTPFVIANAVGFIFALTLILLPVGVVIWIVTLLMTAPRLSQEVEEYNSGLSQ